MINNEQQKLLDVLAKAWAKRPGMRLGQLLVEASFVWGTGEVGESQDDALLAALQDYVGLPKK